MSAHCCHPEPPRNHIPAGYRRALWIALAVNALMFAVEIGAGVRAGSVSLLADAIDFFGDAANYALSLAVLSLGLAWRSGAALIKAASMLAFGVLVLGRAAWSALQGVPPEAVTMGVVGALALAANVGVALLLYAYRDGDANMRSVWLCTRNDALGNLAVLAAALGVFGTGTAWPDLAVAAVMAALAISAGWTVARQARRELATHAAAQH
ncbi:cation transporter [Ramlibacter tataouinensis]|uniref:Candidate Co/Zn/Cd cation transporter n=1 Tax=Ramlibacter tataouinensis (strain ATCC BAA-407 / DSM 14655 / LMG 21543 / TTB310) TaxID=365046 RepID=F5Y1L0_RAMTT|nr:cation transporter [Ramlibacter tataouinensis]AEG92261.1 Candidate Co/Zn/Cd cation transporter [Ramlibacter tataouinensis TTB310]